MRVALVVPHIFMQDELLGDVIFSPGELAMDLAAGLAAAGVEVEFFCPGQVSDSRLDGVSQYNADLSFFDAELKERGYGYKTLLKKHPLTFISLARQVQSELVAKAYALGNSAEIDLVHIYMNEEELALAFADLCKVPVLFTHHEPYNFSTKYRTSFGKYKHRNLISISHSQREAMPEDTNWVGNVYHGLPQNRYNYVPAESSPADQDSKSSEEYIAFLGRIIEPKGVHLAIQAAKAAGIRLKIAGKHYSGYSKDSYWEKIIKPEIDGERVEYVGFLKSIEQKQKFLGNALGLIMPSTWQEPFGMVMIESLACGTPIVGLANGAIPEVVRDGENGFLSDYSPSSKYARDNTQVEVIKSLARNIQKLPKLDRRKVRESFEEKFTLEQMVSGHIELYEKHKA
ncbi:MAG: glycosyltransferase [Candidatus Dojkabacteria bacterium]